MFEELIEVESRDPLSGDEIRARGRARRAAESWPESAVVVAGAIRSDGDDACCGCCPALNFFATAANAERSLGEHPEVRGHPISIEEAAAPRTPSFGNLLSES